MKDTDTNVDTGGLGAKTEKSRYVLLAFTARQGNRK
jgi:hypothetical protein